jgi:hypothetical protein
MTECISVTRRMDNEKLLDWWTARLHSDWRGETQLSRVECENTTNTARSSAAGDLVEDECVVERALTGWCKRQRAVRGQGAVHRAQQPVDTGSWPRCPRRLRTRT